MISKRLVTIMTVSLLFAGCYYVPFGTLPRVIAGQSVFRLSQVITVAGGVSGYLDGTGTAAKFQSPTGIAVDAAGNLYIADTANHAIRKVTPLGVVTTFAGAGGVSGLLDGTGSGAKFQSPSALAFDAAGNLYVADSGNNVIRKITPAGVVTTFAGGGEGFADGTGTAAKFKNPSALAIDSKGNVYVADSGNNVIRKITPAGVVTTFAGGGEGFTDSKGTDAKFKNPTALVFDAAGNLYVADGGNHAIRKVTPDGVVTTLAGGGEGFADGKGKNAKFKTPRALTIDASGNLYVSDDENNAIRKVTPDGDVTTLGGGGPEGGGLKDGKLPDVRFKRPAGLVCLPSGEIYVVDSGNDAVRKVTGDTPANGGSTPDPAPTPTPGVFTIAGIDGTSGSTDGPALSATFTNAYDVDIDSKGDLYVVDTGNSTIRKIHDGVVTTFAGQAGVRGTKDGTGTAATFNQPQSVALDTQDNLYVADSNSATIRKITPAGVVTTFAGKAGVGLGCTDGQGANARFGFPRGLVMDPQDNLYVTDYGTIRKITPDGTVTTVAGKPNLQRPPGPVDGPAGTAEFAWPCDITLDTSGNLYVTESGSIRKVTPDGTVSTWAGKAEVRDWVDGTGTAARFFYSMFEAMDAAGNIYVSDSDNHGIRKVTPAGVVTTITGGQLVNGIRIPANGHQDGSFADARFKMPYGIKFDAVSNSLYVADMTTIRRVRLPR